MKRVELWKGKGDLLCKVTGHKRVKVDAPYTKDGVRYVAYTCKRCNNISGERMDDVDSEKKR